MFTCVPNCLAFLSQTNQQAIARTKMSKTMQILQMKHEAEHKHQTLNTPTSHFRDTDAFISKQIFH